jgi:hypothetical protein
VEGINKIFAYHKPSEDGLAKIGELRQAFSELWDKIILHAPNTRERAVAITNLEQAAMWAVKAVIHNDPGSEVTT